MLGTDPYWPTASCLLNASCFTQEVCANHPQHLVFVSVPLRVRRSARLFTGGRLASDS